MSRGIAAGLRPDGMRLLLDEDVPVQLLEPLRHLLFGHQVEHTDQLGWKGKKDRFLLPDERGG